MIKGSRIGILRAQRREGRHVDAAALVPSDKLRLGEVRVQLELVDGRRDTAGREEFLDLPFAEVGDADVLDLARINQLLHGRPRVAEVDGQVGELPVCIHGTGAWVMHQVEV